MTVAEMDAHQLFGVVYVAMMSGTLTLYCLRILDDENATRGQRLVACVGLLVFFGLSAYAGVAALAP